MPERMPPMSAERSDLLNAILPELNDIGAALALTYKLLNEGPPGSNYILGQMEVIISRAQTAKKMVMQAYGT